MSTINSREEASTAALRGMPRGRFVWVRRLPLDLDAQLAHRAFWWRFSSDRIELLADQVQRDATRAEAHRRLALQLLDAPDDSARMDAVHESRASRRVEGVAK